MKYLDLKDLLFKIYILSNSINNKYMSNIKLLLKFNIIFKILFDYNYRNRSNNKKYKHNYSISTHFIEFSILLMRK